MVFLLFTAMTCVSILFGMYMYYCSENKIKMFSNPSRDYEKRITKLEQEVEQLKKERM